MNVPSEVDAMRTNLEPLGTRERAEGEKQYLKSELEFLGVTVPAVRRAAKAWLRERPGLRR